MPWGMKGRWVGRQGCRSTLQPEIYVAFSLDTTRLKGRN